MMLTLVYAGFGFKNATGDATNGVCRAESFADGFDA
jgi:hypothetical protein